MAKANPKQERWRLEMAQHRSRVQQLEREGIAVVLRQLLVQLSPAEGLV